MNFEDIAKQFDFDLDDSDLDDEPVVMDLDLIKKNLPTYDIQRVCEMVVCERYFGFQNKIGLMCMEELARRRAAGDNFDFETYIDESYKSLPVLRTGDLDLRTVLGQIIDQQKGK